MSPFPLVIVLFRYGDRTFLHPPKTTLEPDPVIDNWIRENGGYGQLTQEGKAELEVLGTKIRDRYLKDVPHYSRNIIHVRSSSFDRTLLSAEAVLSSIWTDRVPIHTVASNKEILFRPDTEEVCPKYITKPLDVPEKEHFVLDDGVTMFNPDVEGDNVRVSRAHNFTDRLDSTNETQNLFIRSYEEYHRARFSLENCKRFGGPLVSEILRIFTSVSKGRFWSNETGFDATLPRPEERLEDPRVVLYSAHDSTILTLMSLIFDNVETVEFPPPASSMVFEMDPNYCITTWYNKGTVDMFTNKLELEHKECITVDDFRQHLGGSDVLYPSIKSWEARCNFEISDYFSWSHAVVGFVAVILVLYFCIRSANKVRERYRQRPSDVFDGLTFGKDDDDSFDF